MLVSRTCFLLMCTQWVQFYIFEEIELFWICISKFSFRYTWSPFKNVNISNWVPWLSYMRIEIAILPSFEQVWPQLSIQEVKYLSDLHWLKNQMLNESYLNIAVILYLLLGNTPNKFKIKKMTQLNETKRQMTCIMMEICDLK